MAPVSVVETSGKTQLRFMKAVPTEGACLACHDQNISSEVQTKLNELNPEDKAIFDKWFDERYNEKLKEQEENSVGRLSIIATKGTMDMVYPPFILASTAAALDN